MHDEANVSYDNWGHDQPNYVDGDQKCVVAEIEWTWAWNDWFCTEKDFIVCELPN
ncbi:hypothetical protein DPMN_061165 [Dreissena polymorpha]|uniref:C-type lectin domain-containing protein n=1 Tax=Dreissena polymorpha TaxID=45954 RepID=A0A9D4C6H9_DREPO|nr:hypothetical protein DPMN_061165 [Dreissena polymorpha]